MKSILILSFLTAVSLSGLAQQKTDKFPLEQYEELTDTKPHDGADVWNKMKLPTMLSWGTTDVRYKKQNVPDIKKNSSFHVKAWRGERVNAQAVIWTNKELKGVTVEVGALKNGKYVIPEDAVKANFVRYVMTDELNKDGKSGCGVRENKAEWDSSLVADALDIVKIQNIKANTVQPVWLNVWVPADAVPGKYKGTLKVKGEGLQPMELQYDVQVSSRVLPDPQQWKFNLDLWQNPYAVARYYQVPLWSKEHFDAMRPIMKMLANAGQCSITASIMHKPWNGQTEDHFDSMVTRIKKIDGTWKYDYAVFDKWVDFMMNDIGINRLISCYTMIPWALTFDYYDEATNRIQFINTQPGEKEYAEYWGVFLKDFAKHLREKGWFDKTAISMDERPMEAMREAIKVIKQADPDFKITLAGNYHPEIEKDLYYLSISYGNLFPEDVKKAREQRGQISTVYTCCAEAFPNTFTFSEPAEAAWTVLHAVAAGYDGYLRWAVNSWPLDPLRDSRFRTWAAGDTYSIYPGPRSSIRFERLIEGLQDCEKIYLLRDELRSKGSESKLEKLNKQVSLFTPEGLSATQQDPSVMVKDLHDMLNNL